MNNRMTSVYFCCALALALPSVFRGQSCIITSPTASQLIQAAQPLQLTATVSSAPTAYSLEYDVDYRRWRKAYNDDQHPKIGDFADNWQGPWVATWYSGLYGDGPHVVSGILRDIFGTTLATCPTISFTVRVEGMSNSVVNLLPNLSGNTISGTGALGILTFDGSNRATSPYIDGRPISGATQICGAVGGTSQNPQVPGTGGSQVPSFNTTCFPNGLRVISYGYNQTAISDPYVVPATIASVSGSSISFATCSPLPGCHSSVQTTVANPDVVTFSTTGSLPTGIIPGQQYYWQAGNADGTVTQTRTGTTIALVLSPSASVTITPGTTQVYVRNLGYTNQGTGINGCDGLYTAATGSTSSTIDLAMSSNPTCPNGTVVAAVAGNPTVFTLIGTLPATKDFINIMGLTGNWANLNNQWRVTQLTSNTFSVGWDSTGYGALTGSGTFAATLSYTGNLEVDINPYFANYIDASHISVSASPSGSSPISLSSSCTGTCKVNQRMRSPYWGGANSNASMSAMPDYAANGGPAVITQQLNFSNGSSPMEIRPPYWEYHGWPGKTGDTLAAIIEKTDLSSSACGGGCSYSVTADGTVSSAISVNTSTGAITYNPTSSWSNPSAPTAWAQATVTCTTCSVGVTSVTVYIEEDPGTSSVYPHWTTCGAIVTTFVGGGPSSCHSFYPLSLQDAGTPTTGWAPSGVFQQGHFNSTMVSLTNTQAGYGLINPTNVTCPTWPDAAMAAQEAFASAYGVQLEFDLQTIWFNAANGFGTNGGGLPAILANTGYNRHACLSALVSHMVATGRYWRFYNDDESSFIQGVILRMNPTIQASLATSDSGWTQAVVSGSSLIFTVQNPITLPGTWSQSAGTGPWIEIVNATNTCLNGWYPINNATSTQWTTNNNGSCANGTYKPSGGTAETTAQMVLNPSYLNGSNNNQQNVSALPARLSAVTQTWDTNLTSIVVSSCAATVHWTGNLIPNGNAIRIWQATTANLNIVAPITSGTNTFTFTYPNTTGEACPANGTYNSSTDASLYITVDPNWGPDPLLQFYNIVDAVSGHPTKSYTMLGSLFGTPASVYSYMGNPTNVDSSFIYLGSSPYFYLGDSAGVWNWINGDTAAAGNQAGLATRAYQLKPRSVLWSWGVVNGGASIQTTCRSFTFNPGCDKPEQLLWRPEDIIAQIMGYKTHDYAALRNYNLASDTTNGYYYFCCGWQAGSTGAGNGNSPYIAPKAFKAAALANALLTLRTETELQPEANKPYFGPFFTTDAHFSATYGNELQIVCGSESPYGSFQVTLPQISGGSMLKYVLTGYSLSMSVLAGNPATDTAEFCATPAQTTTYVALPASPALNPVDHISFSAPATLPFGASKFLLQVGYYAPEMQDDPVTDCTSGCTITVDHHNMAAWYRVVYADSNNQPRSIGDPVQIPSQGLF
jgi:hypothetical protein